MNSANALSDLLDGALTGTVLHEVIAPDGTHGTVASNDLQELPSEYRLTGRLRMYAPDGGHTYAKRREIPKLIEAGYRFHPELPTRLELLTENRALRSRLDELGKIFREAKRPVKTDTQLAAALDVAGLLYEALAGREPVGDLLADLARAKVDYFGLDGFASLLSGLAEFFVPRVLNFLEVRPGEPLASELVQLPARLSVKAEARKRFAEAFRVRIAQLAAQIGVLDAAEVEVYETAVGVDLARYHNGALRAAENGDWSEVDRAFDRHAERSQGQAN